MSGLVFKHYCGIKRDAALGTNGRMTKQTISTANKCLFLPMPSRAEIENNFSVGTAYDVFFPDPAHDVKTGDQLLWNAKAYNVRAARSYEVPRVGHMHCLVTREDV
jgi:hypothetical protein